MAFDYFAKEKVDIAIIEVGLGGRLDSTNVIEPLVSVITNIGFDHKQFLGDTLGKIAYEKSGIIKPHTPVVIGETNLDTKPIFVTIAKLNKAEVHYAETKDFPFYECELKGNYQKHNIKTVLTIISLLQVYFSINKENIEKGLLHITQNTGLKGRWQILNKKPLVICDTAHNEHGLRIVIDQLFDLKSKNLHIVLGVVDDKDLDEILTDITGKKVKSIPAIVNKFGNVNFNGSFTGFQNDFIAYGDFKTQLGRLKSDVNMKINKAGVASYVGKIQAIDFKI